MVESPAPAESSSAATGGWGKKEEEVKPTTNGLGDEIDQIAEVATKEWEEEAELEDKKAVEPVVVVEKKKSAIVKPGSKMSWAQIARWVPIRLYFLRREARRRRGFGFLAYVWSLRGVQLLGGRRDAATASNLDTSKELTS